MLVDDDRTADPAERSPRRRRGPRAAPCSPPTTSPARGAGARAPRRPRPASPAGRPGRARRAPILIPTPIASPVAPGHRPPAVRRLRVVAGREPCGDGGDHRRRHRVGGKVVTGRVEERGGVVGELEMHGEVSHPRPRSQPVSPRGASALGFRHDRHAGSPGSPTRRAPRSPSWRYPTSLRSRASRPGWSQRWKADDTYAFDRTRPREEVYSIDTRRPP